MGYVCIFWSRGDPAQAMRSDIDASIIDLVPDRVWLMPTEVSYWAATNSILEYIYSEFWYETSKKWILFSQLPRGGN